MSIDAQTLAEDIVRVLDSKYVILHSDGNTFAGRGELVNDVKAVLNIVRGPQGTQGRD
jgi:hypothetical protein